MSGKLYLIPTPIDGESRLCKENFDLIEKACINKEKSIFVMEDPKTARRAWIRFGFNREFINEFVYYNEQTRSDTLEELIKGLRSGKDVYLMSDCGPPAFCDPGVRFDKKTSDFARIFSKSCLSRGSLRFILIDSFPRFNQANMALFPSAPMS